MEVTETTPTNVQKKSKERKPKNANAVAEMILLKKKRNKAKQIF